MKNNLLTSGPLPSDVMFVGEAPGLTEIRRGLPFVGKSGQLQSKLLSVHGCSARRYYMTNISKSYNRGNPDPTLEEIEKWKPVLMDEIRDCKPKLIVSVGAFASRWFLGQSLKISQIHGVLHEIGAFDKTLEIPTDAKILPIVHPASGFRNDRMRELVFTDYMAVAESITLVESGKELICPTVDLYPDTDYRDLSGKGVRKLLNDLGPNDAVAIDTEFSRESPWSIQFCFEPGKAYMLRCSRKDFGVGIEALSKYFHRNNILVILHNSNTPIGCMVDFTKCQEMGLDLSIFDIFDTMYDAYLRRTEPQGLKALMWRCAGMVGVEYRDTVSSSEGQIKYLNMVRDLNLPAPGAYQVVDPDGTKKLYRPRSLSSRAKYYLNKIERDATWLEDEDLNKKWTTITGTGDRLEIQKDLREELEWAIGPMPETTLEDIPLKESTKYACRDADGTFRVWLARGGHEAGSRIHFDGTAVLKILEKMQRKGMPIDPLFFEGLIVEINQKLKVLERKVEIKYNNRMPFNPNSVPNVVQLLKRNNVETKKKTPKGDPSTGTDSIEHLRTQIELVDLILQCRELRNKRDKFCKVVLKHRDHGDNVKYCLGITTASRRLTSTKPNMLAVPTKDRHGWNIRNGFVSPKGYYYAAFDYSQQEMCFMAHESEDETLCKFYREGRDVHTETACSIFGVTKDQLDSETQRRPAKAVNFGLIYGISAFRLANELQSQGLDWKADKCQDFMNEVLHLYPGIERYKRQVIRFVRECGYVEDHWGMRRYLPGILDTRDKAVSGEAERQAVNFRIQAGSQGQTQRAMIWIEKQRKLDEIGADWRLQVHDELVFMVAKGGISRLRDLVMDGMVNHCGIKLRVPIKVEAHFAKTWGGLK